MKKRNFGTSLDPLILQLCHAGADIGEIAEELAVSTCTVWFRAGAIGLRRVLAERGAEARRIKAAAPRTRAVRSVALAHRDDDRASRLLRDLRAHRPTTAIACVDPDHIAACLHHRGLTLPEIQEVAGIQPRDAVAAIRAHAGSLAA